MMDRFASGSPGAVEVALAKQRVMSGMRATGTLHVGHYLGVLVNWVRMQAEYDCYFAVADWHMLTTGFAKTEGLRENTRAILLDWLAAGVDPEAATIFVQSSVPETAELHLLLSMITPVNWLQRDPTLKETVRELKLAEDTVSYGLLGYPELMTADILVLRGQLVPVGEDQLAHLEISRDIARRFNHLFGTELFPEPRGLLTETPVVIGLDGRKMSKSYANDLKLGDSAEAVEAKIRTAVTDPARIRRTDPGHPDVCAVYGLWETLAPERGPEIAEACRKATIGCVACKKELAAAVNARFEPLRERRARYAENPGALDEVLAHGAGKARAAAKETMTAVREAMRLNQPFEVR